MSPNDPNAGGPDRAAHRDPGPQGRPAGLGSPLPPGPGVGGPDGGARNAGRNGSDPDNAGRNAPGPAPADPGSPDRPDPGKPSTANEQAEKVGAAGRLLTRSADPGQDEMLAGAWSDYGLQRPNVVTTTITQNVQTFDGHGGTTVRAYPMPVEQLQRRIEPGPGTDELRATVRDRNFVVVRGPAGIGKTAALLAAIDGRPRRPVSVHRLESGGGLRALSVEQFPEGAAIVLPDLPAAAAAGLDDFTVDRLASELGRRQSVLAVTAGDDVVLPESPRLAVVELRAGPEPRAVFELHLMRELASDAGARAALLADPAVAELLDEQLTASTTMERAASIARVLGEAKADPASAARTVRTRLDGNGYEACKRWFQGLPGLRAQCVAISLAVLNTLPREMVTAAADRLEKLISPKPDLSVAPSVVGGTTAADSPFASGRSLSPADLRARVEPGSRQTRYGELPHTSMRYELRDYPLWLLQHVWRDHDLVRGPLVEWLEELGRDGNLNVRIRAATAVGRLAIEAFDFVHPRIVRRWAADEDSDVRDSAAHALGPPAADERLRPLVQGLIDEWSVETGDHRLLRATAARTYGTGGPGHPGHALRKLAELAEINDIDVAVAVAKSLGEILGRGTPALGGRVLAEVERWVRQPGRDLQLVGRFAFLQMSHLWTVPESLRATYGMDSGLPTLMLLAGHVPPARRRLAGLWADGLNSSALHSLCQESLDGWARAVEDDTAARTLFVELMTLAAADPRTASILARAAEGWAGDTGCARRTGHALLTMITGVPTHV